MPPSATTTLSSCRPRTLWCPAPRPYRGFLNYWPSIADDPAQPEVERAISRRHRELEHLVVSNSLTAEETGPWQEKTRIVRRGEARDAIAQAKEGEGGTLLVFGSMTTWNDLLAACLVDELHMMVGAGVLIDGLPAFSVRPPGPMRLIGARQLGDSNIALLLYALGDCPPIWLVPSTWGKT